MWWYVPSLAPPHFTWVLPCLAWAWKLFHVFLLGTWLLLSLFPTPKPEPVPPWICRAGKALQVLSQMKCLELKQESPRHCLISGHWCGLAVLWGGLTPSGWAQQFPPGFLCSSEGTSGERPKDFSARVCTWHRGAGRAVTGQLCLLSWKVISSALFFVMHI